MDRVFEDEFMDAQSRIISLCVEFAGNRTDKVYAYGCEVTCRMRMRGTEPGKSCFSR